MPRIQQLIDAARRALARPNLPLLLDKIIEYGCYVYLFALFRANTLRTIAIAVVTTAWLVKLALARGADLRYLRLPVVGIGGLFFGLTLLSVLYSTDVPAALIEYAQTLGLAALMALIFSYALRDERMLRRLLSVALFTALYLNFIQFKGIVVEYSRVGALLQDVNIHRPHALSLIFYLPFVVALAILSKGWRSNLLLGIAALQCVLLATTAGRAATLSIASGFAVWFLLRAKSGPVISRFAVAGAVTLAMVAALLAILPSTSFVIHWIEKGFYVEDRVEAAWGPALKMIASNPIAGYGYGTFVYPQIFELQMPPGDFSAWPREWMKQLGPHNYYLETWFSSGLLALIAMVWLFVRFFADIWRVAHDALSPELRQLGAATVASFTALYFVHAQFGPLGPSGLRPLGVLFGIGVALLAINRTHSAFVSEERKMSDAASQARR